MFFLGDTEQEKYFSSGYRAKEMFSSRCREGDIRENVFLGLQNRINVFLENTEQKKSFLGDTEQEKCFP